MKLKDKLKEIWKLNHKGLYISLGVIFLGAILINVIQHNSQIALIPQMLFSFIFTNIMMFGIGFLTWSDE